MSVTTTIPHVETSSTLTGVTLLKMLETVPWGKGVVPDNDMTKKGGEGLKALYSIADSDTSCEGKLTVKASKLPSGFGGIGQRSGVWTIDTFVKSVSSLNDVVTLTPINASLAVNVGLTAFMPTAAQLMQLITNLYTYTFAKCLTNSPDPARVSQVLLYGNPGVIGWSPT